MDWKFTSEKDLANTFNNTIDPFWEEQVSRESGKQMSKGVDSVCILHSSLLGV